MELQWRSRKITLPSGSIMGILNVTPDSFSDGGSYLALEAAVLRAREMTRAGASFIDVGGESTRPGALSVPVETELQRVIPVIEALHAQRLKEGSEVLISIDTRKAEVARCALAAGADLVNDVSGLQDQEMRQVCASFGVPAVLMHMPATPEEMGWSQSSGVFTDIVAEVSKALSQLAVQALADGVPSVILDPGFGFGKSIQQNFELIRGLDEICSLGHPVMLGASRKSSLSRIAGAGSPEALVPASLAAHLYGFQRGADILRVHDVEAHIQAIRIWKYLEQKDS